MKSLTTLLITLAIAYSQNEFVKFNSISIDDGLSIAYVTDIAQDNYGYLWFATIDGLNRYDGYSFFVYRKGGEYGIADNSVNTIEVSSENVLWIGTKNGLTRFDINNYTFKNFFVSSQSGVQNANNIIGIIIPREGAESIIVATNNQVYRLNVGTGESAVIDKDAISGSINRLFQDEEGNIWIAATDGLHRLNGTTIESVSVDFSTSNTNVIGLQEDITGDLWVVTSDEIVIYNSQKNESYNRQNRAGFFRPFPSNLSGAIYSDAQNNIWVGTVNQGLYRYSYARNSFEQYQNSKWNSNSLSSDYVTDIFEDNAGLYWVGTIGGGVSKMRLYDSGHFQHVLNNPLDPNSIAGNRVHAIFQDKDDNTWYGTELNGVSIKDASTGRFSHIKKDVQGNTISQINSFTQDRRGRIWVGANSGLYLFNAQRKTLTSQHSINIRGTEICVLYVDRDGIIWIGTTDGLYKYDPENLDLAHYKSDWNTNSTLSNPIVTAILEDNDNNLWVGTGYGLNKFIRRTGTFRRYMSRGDDANSISDNDIIALDFDKRNTLWIGTSNGLNAFDIANNTFSRFSTIDGLPNNYINGILHDENNNLWISTNFGLSQYNQKDSVFKNYEESDGLQGNQFLRHSYYRDKNLRMYFGGLNGVTEFFPDFIYFNLNRAPVVISAIQINYEDYLINKSYNEISEIELEWFDNTISFSLASLDYTIPSKNQYRYMLEGYHTDWIEAGNDRVVRFTNLDAKDYRLRILASNNDGIWTSNERQIAILITPPFWETPWFVWLVIFVIAGSAFTFYRVKINRERRMRALLEEKVEERTKEVVEKSKEIEKANAELSSEIDVRKKTEAELVQANKQAEAIFENVSEGLFLITPDYKISEQRSIELDKIFLSENLGRADFTQLMKPLVTDRIHGAIINYINLLFNPEIDEDVVQELNPLDQVEAHFEKEAGVFVTKIIEFSFERIVTDGNIGTLLVTVRDVTETVELQKKLEENERKKQEEMEQLLSILKVDNRMLQNYIHKIDETLKEIKAQFKKQRQIESFGDFLNEIFRNIHNLKSNAGTLGLDFFVAKFDAMETYITEMKHKANLTGDSFLPLLFLINDATELNENMKKMVQRVLKFSRSVEKDREMEYKVDLDLIEKTLQNRVSTLSQELGKKAKFILDNKDNIELPEGYLEPVQDLTLQLVRNSLAHGVETPDVREQRNKEKVASLKLSIRKVNDKIFLRYRDDGNGLDIEKIKIKALESGKFTKEQVKEMKTSDVVKLIFNDGMSTHDGVSEHAGRGEGMSLVKQLVKKMNGKMKIAFARGKYFEMGIELTT